jgi:hypothetical protein
MNFIVWQMPFTLLGFGLIGRAAESLVARNGVRDIGIGFQRMRGDWNSG